jgi:hypothetical protein
VTISSRTPEGDPNRCVICGYDCRLEPSWPAREAPCPRCGHLLWFPAESSSVAVDLDAAVLKIIEARFGLLSPELRSSVMARIQRADRKQVLRRAVVASRLEDLFVDG